MKKPTKSIITSSLLALAFGAMSVGSTFALFTSQSQTEINVGSGVVNVESSASLARYKSSVDNSDVDLAGSNTYSNSLVGNRFSLDGNIVTIDKMVPGDSLTLKLSAINKSNVKTKTRYVVNHSVVGTKTDLYPALKFTFSAGADLFKWRVNEPVADISTGVALYDDLSVTITFPDGDNGEILFGSENHDNQYQDAACSIAFSLQAVQANAATSPIDEINAYLEVEKMLGHENFTMHDAVLDMAAIGYTNLSVLEGYVYDLANDQFVKESSVTANKVNYFKVCSSMPTTQDFSIYAVGNSWTSAINNLTVGFDAGDTSGITSITYDRHDAEEEQEVTIRTNSAQTTLTVNAPLDTIHHYDALGALNIIEAATASYHEFGSIAYAEIAKGRIVLEKGADVNQIHINKIADEQAFDTVIIANNGGAAELPERITRDAVTVSSQTLVVTVESNGTSENVYVYAEGQKGSTEKVTEGENKQNENVESALGQLVLDNGSEPGEKAQTTEEKEEAKAENVNKAVYQEKIDAVSTKWTGETVELVKVTRDWMKIKNNLLYYVLPSDTVYGSGFGENRPADSEEEFNEYYDNAVSFATMVETTLSGKFYLDTNEKTIHVCGADCLQYLYLLDDYLSAKNQIACKETKYPFGVFYNAEVRWVIKVDNDIDLGGKIENDNIINNWTPVNSQLAVDFQGHKVTNLVTDRYIVEDGSIASTSGASGLFGFTRGQIKNLVLENVTIFNLSASKESCAGAIAGNIASGIFNCKVINANIISSKWVGGIAGIGYGSIENCTIENSTITAGYKIGGLIGQSSTTGNGTAGPSIDFKNNTLKNVTIQINKEIAGKTGYDVGKLVGYLQNNSTITGNTLTNVSIKVSSESGYVDLTEDIEIHKGHNGSTMLYDENGLVGIYEASFTVTF